MSLRGGFTRKGGTNSAVSRVTTRPPDPAPLKPRGPVVEIIEKGADVLPRLPPSMRHEWKPLHPIVFYAVLVALLILIAVLAVEV